MQCAVGRGGCKSLPVGQGVEAEQRTQCISCGGCVQRSAGVVLAGQADGCVTHPFHLDEGVRIRDMQCPGDKAAVTRGNFQVFGQSGRHRLAQRRGERIGQDAGLAESVKRCGKLVQFGRGGGAGIIPVGKVIPGQPELAGHFHRLPGGGEQADACFGSQHPPRKRGIPHGKPGGRQAGQQGQRQYGGCAERSSL